MFRAVEYVSLKNKQSESVFIGTIIIKMSVDFGGFCSIKLNENRGSNFTVRKNRA